MSSLSFYIKKFTHLKRATSKGEKAPHKPILLLSVLRLIETGLINDNRIYISPELVAAFKDYWQLLITGVNFTTNFSLPFYHLRSEGFWHLHTYPGKEILLTRSNSIKSFGHLKKAVWFASFDEALFALLRNAQDRAILQQTLLQTYFPKAASSTIEKEGGLSNEIEKQILNEPAAIYRQQIAAADEEEVFIRSGIFKKLVPSVYNYTCCISGMQITSAYNIQMIDACHIVPFSLSHDDTIVNGIPLCPNLHRAFDRGLITINESYKVVVSKSFSENESNYRIYPYEGATILLPTQKRYYPSTENLAWHRQHIFKP